eukprot:COSAG01_NODE_3504_length_5994_cov_47.750000_9_plen_64_part_01
MPPPPIRAMAHCITSTVHQADGYPGVCGSTNTTLRPCNASVFAPIDSQIGTRSAALALSTQPAR